MNKSINRDWFEDVLSFHKKFKCLIGTKPEFPDSEAFYLRQKLITEEFTEVINAMGAKDIAGTADGLADLAYVVVGTAIALGIDLRIVWDEVHQANMKKDGGGVREDGKILKPKGWKPPNIEKILSQQEVFHD